APGPLDGALPGGTPQLLGPRGEGQEVLERLACHRVADNRRSPLATVDESLAAQGRQRGSDCSTGGAELLAQPRLGRQGGAGGEHTAVDSPAELIGDARMNRQAHGEDCTT